jgi:hypothetical protein
MFIQAKTPIKIAADTVINEDSPPTEVDDKTGAELVKIGAADEVEAPAPKSKK